MLHSERFLKIVEEAQQNVAELTPEETLAMQQRGEQFLLIDTREDREWAAGHIAGAIHIGKGVMERDIEKAVPDTETPLVLYCGGGFRSILAADALQRMGYTNVRSMSGGWRGWNDLGYPVE
ncbi:MAG: sulfurtransferase [Armatimonadetes bacterium]|nr:sulfurtransferase [Armatimonadota bacterium]